MRDDRRASWQAVLRDRQGRDYWRGLDELLDTPEFRDALAHEFPMGAAERGDGINRRSFFKLLGASLALAGVGACTSMPDEKILPYVNQPPEITPGIPLHYATSMVLDGYATGLLVESHAGRPTKIEGNPDHPASLGASGVYEQASVLELYDPHRARAMRSPQGRATWSTFAQTFSPTSLRNHVGARGAGLRVLLEPTSSPLTAELLARLHDAYPDAVVYFYSPLESQSAIAGARSAVGRPIDTQYDFHHTDVVLALDSDFLARGPFHLRYARDFAARRHIARPVDEMNRLYVAEAMLTPTGSLADNRLRIRASEIESLLAGVLAEVVIALGLKPPGIPPVFTDALVRHRTSAVSTAHRAWIQAVARDLRANAGRSIVIAGEQQPASVHAMAHVLNAALGNVGSTVWHTPSPILDAGEPTHGLFPLMAELQSGDVDTLVILGGNPAYTAPVDFALDRRLRAVPHSVYVGLFENETASGARWFVPAAHYLESWGDARAYDGTASVIQPLIAPMYGGKTVDEVLAVLTGNASPNAHTLVQDAWRGRAGTSDFATFWDTTLHRGLVRDSAFARIRTALHWETLTPLMRGLASDAGPASVAGARVSSDTNAPARAGASAPIVEVVFRQDAKVYDGRFANNAWLQELPEPMTKLTWDNAAIVSPATATRLGIDTGDVVQLHNGQRSIRIPALILPGHADDSVSLQLGYGRRGAETVARGVGVDVSTLRASTTPYIATGFTLERTAEHHNLAITQEHWAMHGRDIVRQATIDEYRRNPRFTAAQNARVLTLYQENPLDTGDQWAMTVDLSLCTGCSACVVACQAENNIPVVGKSDVLMSREMHWLRIDRYFSGPPDDPEVVTQPMLCQQCEKAPCEYVCPVNATVHSPDGLNEMVYNRCVGTRFCSNNCPYKVRRFNWFDYNAEISETEEMVKNPQVTVRGRGVMEKCTFCVQRIRRSQIEAQIEDRPLQPNEVQTACQQACPTHAIVFGSFTNPDSQVARELEQDRAYAVLHELGTQPRVRYLARITNPNPAARGEEG
ncbi:MAG TPA: TAT-variant-translocated molybdopterin oxidoreductase [Gemmatimonadaceae bacterium]|nr:TAT-variant-translocated molybdopterin oxidoreductase [Gemmatimonadaceae bacterium]